MSIDAFPPSMTTTTDDDTLDALAGLSTSANTMPYFTGVDTAALTALTPFMRTLLDDPDLAAAQSTLGITGGGGGAPTDAVYIVGSASATLTQERVLTTTPTVSWDLTTPGQAKAVVQDASITEVKLNISDVTTQNVSTTAHGLTPKLSGVSTQYLSGVGTWTVPPVGTTYTDEQAQDAVGAMLTDTATIDLTYGDGGPTLQADVKDSSITEAKLTFVDVTTRDASTSTHGLLRKLSGVVTEYLNGNGAWTTPASSDATPGSVFLHMGA